MALAEMLAGLGCLCEATAAVDAAREEIEALAQPVRAPAAAVVAAGIALAEGRLDEAAAEADGALGSPVGCSRIGGRRGQGPVLPSGLAARTHGSPFLHPF